MSTGFLSSIQFFVRKTWPFLLALSVICSIAFPLSTFWFESDLAIIGLAVFSGFLLILLVLISYVLLKTLEKANTKGYSNKSLLYRYVTEDGLNSQQDFFRVIQCRTAFMDRVIFKFRWKGDQRPSEISSQKQTLGKITYQDGENSYDQIPLIFKKGIAYKDNHLIHLSLKFFDPEKTAPPHIGFVIDEPIEVIHFQITLKHKQAKYKQPAKVMMKKVGNPSAELKFVESISFDPAMKTYTYDLIEPKVGHYYRIVWEH